MPEKKEDKWKLYFIGIVPPSPFFDEALQVKQYVSDKYRSKGALKSPPHITLRMPFKWDEEKEEELIGLLNKFVTSCTQKPFELQLKNFGCFEPRVIFIAVEESESLLRLQQELKQFCKTDLNLFDATNKERPYHPHLTVAFRDLKKVDFYKAWDEFKDKVFSGNFLVKEFVLLKHNGRVWEKFKSFPLPVK